MLGGVLDLDHRQHAGGGGQFGHAAGQSGDGGFVADQQVPVKVRRDEQRTTRAANDQGLADRRLCRPARGGAIAMQHEIEIERARIHVIGAWGIIAHLRLFAGGELGAIGSDGHQSGRDAGRKEEDLDVIGMAGRGKAGHVAGEANAPHAGRQARNAAHGEQPHPGFMAKAPGRPGIVDHVHA